MTEHIEFVFNERDKRIIELWGNCYTAFNKITFDGRVYTISGADYSENITFMHYNELIAFIERDVKECLLNYAINSDLQELDLMI